MVKMTEPAANFGAEEGVHLRRPCAWHHGIPTGIQPSDVVHWSENRRSEGTAFFNRRIGRNSATQRTTRRRHKWATNDGRGWICLEILPSPKNRRVCLDRSLPPTVAARRIPSIVDAEVFIHALKSFDFKDEGPFNCSAN